MTFRIPLSSFVDQAARDAAAAAQNTANSAANAALNAQDAATQAITLAEDPVGQIPDGALSGSKLAADAIDGRTITGATIRTAAAPAQRVQIDSTNGLVGYDAAGAAVTQVRNSDGRLIATGATITGELDTGDPTGGRVRIYEQSDANGRWGVVEFDDPAADGPATLTARINAGAGGSVQGSLTSLVGMPANGKTAPRLDMQIAAGPVSGQAATASLTAPDGFFVNSQPWARQRTWEIPRTGHTSDPFAAGAPADLIDVTIPNAPAGDWRLTAQMVFSSTSGTAAFVWIVVNNNTANPIKSGRDDLPVATVADRKIVTCGYTHPGGDLRIAGFAQISSGTGTVISAGTAITADFLGPRT